MGQIELFDHLTVCKQITDAKLDCVISQYSKAFNYVQIKLLVLEWNT